jgi:DNA-binding response OmpR family regulator
VSRILIVEDSEDTAAAVARVLGLEREVRCAGDGNEALACAVGFVPKIVFRRPLAARDFGI